MVSHFFNVFSNTLNLWFQILSILFSISHSCKLRGLKSLNMTVMRLYPSLLTQIFSISLSICFMIFEFAYLTLCPFITVLPLSLVLLLSFSILAWQNVLLLSLLFSLSGNSESCTWGSWCDDCAVFAESGGIRLILSVYF